MTAHSQTPPAPAPAASPMPAAGAGSDALRPGDLVHLDGRPQQWRVVDFHGPLVRISPVPRTGRIVHPERLTRAEAHS